MYHAVVNYYLNCWQYYPSLLTILVATSTIIIGNEADNSC